MIKAIFWDNDGVLVDTERLCFRATQHVLATVGIPLTKEQDIDLFLVQGKGAWHLAADKGLSPSAIAQLRHARNTIYSTLLSQEPLLMAGVREVLDALHGAYVMEIVTSSAPDHLALIHQTTGLLPYFRFVLTASDCTHSKPHPEPYLRAIERSSCHKEKCLVIEDSERGLMAAKAAGLPCMVVPSEFTRGSNFAGADKVLENLADLLAELSQQGMSLPNKGFAANRLQRPLRSRFQRRLKPGVEQRTPGFPSAPLRGEPGVRTDAPPGHCSTRALDRLNARREV
jgi:HAD superfamily hydrolase (TIGR01509 family)